MLRYDGSGIIPISRSHWIRYTNLNSFFSFAECSKILNPIKIKTR